MPDLITAIDVSSHQGTDIGPLIDRFQPAHVIVKLYLPQELGGTGAGDYTIPQAQTARERGCTLGGYVWGYADLDPARTIRHAKAVADAAGIVIDGSVIGYDSLLQQPIHGILWLDIETYVDSWTGDESIPDVDWISAAEAEANRLGVSMGIYTSPEMWRRATGDSFNTEFRHLSLWAAQYTPPAPDIDAYRPFGGWARCQGRQWTSTPIDQNVFRRADTMTQPQIDEVNRVKGVFQSWAANMAARSAQAESWGYDIKDDLSARMAAELQGAVDGLDWVLQQG